MIQWYADHIVPKHRVFFVLATALLGVAGSFVASSPTKITYWLAFGGLVLAMYAADICAEIEAEVRLVAQPKRFDKRKTRVGSLMSKKPRRLIGISAISVALVVVGFVGGAVDGDNWVADHTLRGGNLKSGTPTSESPISEGVLPSGPGDPVSR